LTVNTIQSDAWNFAHHNFCCEIPDGVPLGNGDLGALVIPYHKRTTFRLAKSNVWDERCDDGTGRRRSFRVAERFATVRQWIEREQWERIELAFAEATRKWRGKFCLLPAGALVLDTSRFEHEIELLDFGYRLDMQRALVATSFQTRVRRQLIEALVSVEHQVLAIRVRHQMDWRRGNPPRPMTFGMDLTLENQPQDPKATVAAGCTGGILWHRVRGWHNEDYTIAVLAQGAARGSQVAASAQRITLTAESRAEFVIYLALVSHRDTPAAKTEACRRVWAAAAAGFGRIHTTHRRWWTMFWNASRVQIPDTNLLRQYHFGLYLLGSSSRRGCLMPGLQGLWRMEPEGKSWNDYTNDLNIQMNYWPIYASNHLELGWPYYDTVRGWLVESRRFTREYWGCRGVQFSCCASPHAGLAPRGYVTTLHWAGHAAFVAQNFWTHYQYSRDKRFLREVAYPFLKECAAFYLDFLTKNRRGQYDIWPSNTPEAGEGSYEAWGKNPAMDLALIRLLFRAVMESCDTLGCDADLARQCRERLAHLPPYPMRRGHLIEMESKEFLYSHRHPGVLTPVYPCADLTGPPAERSLDRFIEKGRWLWGGFSPVWVAAACARVGRGDQARDLLREFMDVYTSATGGFNWNFDFRGTGRGMAAAKIFTNETNSGFSAALLEMLLQSHNGMIRVFPAVPRDWKDVSFAKLRAAGAFLVSARRRKGRTVEIIIHSELGGTARVKSPWRHKIITLSLKRRQTIRLRP
jgi:hypothetical protein